MSLPPVDLSLGLLQQISTQCYTQELDLLQQKYNGNEKGEEGEEKVNALMFKARKKNLKYL